MGVRGDPDMSELTLRRPFLAVSHRRSHEARGKSGEQVQGSSSNLVTRQDSNRRKATVAMTTDETGLAALGELEPPSPSPAPFTRPRHRQDAYRRPNGAKTASPTQLVR